MHILCIVNVVVILSNVHKKGANHSRDEIKHINYICGKRKLTMPMSSDAKFSLSLMRDSYIKIYIYTYKDSL